MGEFYQIHSEVSNIHGQVYILCIILVTIFNILPLVLFHSVAFYFLENVKNSQRIQTLFQLF